jgi:hypothetical protein
VKAAAPLNPHHSIRATVVALRMATLTANGTDTTAISTAQPRNRRENPTSDGLDWLVG